MSEIKHSTKEEIYYIQNIGRFSDQTKSIDKEVMLHNYLIGASMRTDWGDVSKSACIQCAKQQLALIAV